MEKNPYLTIMIQSLKKKSAVLDAVIELNIRQKEELENPALIRMTLTPAWRKKQSRSNSWNFLTPDSRRSTIR